MPEIVIPRIKGMHRDVPYGQAIQQDGAYAEILNNLRVDGEEISRRPGTVAGSNPPTVPTVIGATQTDFEVVYFREVNIEPGGISRFALFTERDGWLGSPTRGWSQINPRHDDGTIDVTNGSTTVTGNSTAWETRGIKPVDYLDAPDGNLYEIASVDSETQVTLQSAYQGATASAQSYEVVRAFDFSESGGVGENPRVPMLATQIGDLYVAGVVAGGTFSSSQVADFGIFKVTQGADAAKESWATADITYMTAGANEVESGVDNIGDIVNMRGFGKLSDGRFVVGGHFIDPSVTFSGNRRVWFSSHLNPAVWTTSPGGFTDLEETDGSMTAVVFYSRSVSVHMSDGIVVGELTGQDEPPLQFRPTKARVGAVGPRMVVSASGGRAIPAREIYLGADLGVYAFSGADSRPVDIAGIEREFVEIGNKGPTAKNSLRDGFSFIDGSRSEVAFCFYFDEGAPSASFGNKTREVRINYETGALWRAQYAGRVNDAFVPRVYGFSTSGAWDFNPVEDRLVIATSTGSSWYWVLEEQQTDDTFSRSGSNMDGVYMRIGGIDAGDPKKTKVGKHVIVYCRENPYTATGGYALQVRVKTDEVDTGTMVLRENVDPSSSSPVKSSIFRGEFPAIFYFPESNKWRNLDLEIGSNDDDSFPLTITRILIDYEFTGDTRADA